MSLSTSLKNRLDVALRSVGDAEELAAVANLVASSTPGTTSAGQTVVCDANGNILFAGQLYQSFVDTITAQHASPSQSTATHLTGMINRITTVTAAGDAVALPAAVAGLEIQIVNHGANYVQVYGNNTAGDKINDTATGTGIPQMAGSSWVYSCVTAGNWYVQTGEGYSGSLATQSSVDSLTAQHTSPSQATGTAVVAMVNRFTTVTADNDAATLPASANGLSITIINAGAHILKVYPNAGGTTTETINALSANAAYSISAAGVVTFICCTAGQWHTILSGG